MVVDDRDSLVVPEPWDEEVRRVHLPDLVDRLRRLLPLLRRRPLIQRSLSDQPERLEHSINRRFAHGHAVLIPQHHRQKPTPQLRMFAGLALDQVSFGLAQTIPGPLGSTAFGEVYPYFFIPKYALYSALSVLLSALTLARLAEGGR